jgi:hypothetical protein
MNEEALKKAEEALKFLATKLGVATTEFWPTFIRKQILDGVVVAVWLGITITASAVLLPICFHWPEATNLDRYDLDVGWWFSRVLGVILSLITLNTIHDAIEQIKYLGNLKYWALQDFAQTIGNMFNARVEL